MGLPVLDRENGEGEDRTHVIASVEPSMRLHRAPSDALFGSAGSPLIRPTSGQVRAAVAVASASEPTSARLPPLSPRRGRIAGAHPR
jgi:hypothetical protein